MDSRDQEFINLLTEVAQLVIGVLNEGMKGEAFQESLDNINRRMLKDFGHAVGAIAMRIEVVTLAMSGEKEMGDLKPSLKFRFGGSKEDKEMGKELGLTEDEMNRFLDEARRRSGGSGGGVNLTDTKSSPGPWAEEERTSNPVDLRSIGQIINSIRIIARTLSFNQRRLLVKRISESSGMLGQLIVPITEERMKNDVAWLQWLQNLFGGIQGYFGSESQTRRVFLILEKLFLRAGTE
jgi:hypothetical protein